MWAIGVILINIITGRNPWHYASPIQDLGFRQYLADGASYLSEALALSQSAAALLSRILDPNPATRITLPELRKATFEVDTFFEATRSCCPKAPLDPYAHLYNTDPFHAMQSELSYAPVVDLLDPHANMPVDPNAFAIPPPLDPPSQRLSSGSGADSNGPITPPTSAQIPSVVCDGSIPEICLDGTRALGQSQRRSGGLLRVNRKRVFNGIGLGIGSLGSSGSRLSRKLKQAYRVGESAQRFVGVMRELKLRA